MYSPADLPSSTRAAPAKKRRLSAADRHLVARVRRAACRRSATRSRRAPRAFSSSASASFSSTSARSPGVVSSHSGSAFFAACDGRGRRPRRAARHLGDRLAGRRVQHLHRLAARRRRPTRRRRSSGAAKPWSLIALPPRSLRDRHGVPDLAGQPLRERHRDDRQPAGSGRRRRSPRAAAGRGGCCRRSRSAACSARRP